MWAMIEKLRVNSVDIGRKNRRGGAEGKQEPDPKARKIRSPRGKNLRRCRNRRPRQPTPAGFNKPGREPASPRPVTAQAAGGKPIRSTQIQREIFQLKWRISRLTARPESLERDRTWLGREPVVTSIGPRQCGKTTPAFPAFPAWHTLSGPLETPL